MVAENEAETVATPEAVAAPPAPKPEHPNGVLGTAITWDMVESDFQKKFGTTAKIGEAKSAVKFGENNGFISKIALVDFDWTEKDDRLPEKAILKITDPSNLAEMCELIFQKKYEDMKIGAKQIHNNEIHAYEVIHEHWKAAEALKMPAFYCAREFDDELDAGYIAMEYFENAVLRHMYHNVGVDSCEEVFRLIAKLGAISLKDPETTATFKHSFIVEMMQDFFNVEKVRAGLPTLVKLVPEMESELEFLMTKIEVLADMKTYEAALDAGGCRKILCHGDLWTANMLWKEDANGGFRLQRLIDWQITHQGTPAEDLVRFFNCAISDEDKQANLDRLLKLYYDALKEECGTEIEVPFTLQQLTESYEKLIPITTVPFLPLFGPMIDMVIGKVPENERADAEKVFYERLRGSVHEAVRYIKKWY